MSLVLARIGKPHGLRGEVTVRLHTDEPETRFAVGAVLDTEAELTSRLASRATAHGPDFPDVDATLSAEAAARLAASDYEPHARYGARQLTLLKRLPALGRKTSALNSVD